MRRFRASIVAALVFALNQTLTIAAPQSSELPPIVGRWDITVTAPDGTYPSWLEVEPSGTKTLVGRFVGRWGSSRPVAEIHYENGKMSFTVPLQWEKGPSELAFEGQVEAGALRGTTTDASGAKFPWTAVRAPELLAPVAPHWDKPVTLFNGTDLSGWVARDSQTNNWRVRDKTLVNTAAGADIETAAKYRDFKLHVEFRYPTNSNSGVYLRGRYEVQITDNDNHGVPRCGLASVYGFLEPSENPPSRPGEWQTYDITLLGRTVTVALNGKTMISERIIPGITGGALDCDEGAPGPILIQGDHGPIEYRSIVLTPTK